MIQGIRNIIQPIAVLPHPQLEQLRLFFENEPDQFFRGLAQKIHAVDEEVVIFELKRVVRIIFLLKDGKFNRFITESAQELAESLIAIHNNREIGDILENTLIKQINILFQEYLAVFLWDKMFQKYMFMQFFNGNMFSLDDHVNSLISCSNFGGDDRLPDLNDDILCIMYRCERLFKGIYGADFQKYLEGHVAYQTLWGGAAKLLNYIAKKNFSEKTTREFFLDARNLFREGVHFSFMEGLKKLGIECWPEVIVPFQNEEFEDDYYLGCFAAHQEVQKKEEWKKNRDNLEENLYYNYRKSKNIGDLHAVLDGIFIDLENAHRMLEEGENSAILKKIETKISSPTVVNNLMFSNRIEEFFVALLQFYEWIVLKECQRLCPEDRWMLLEVNVAGGDFLLLADIRREIEDIIELAPLDEEGGCNVLDLKLLSYWGNVRFFAQLFYGNNIKIDRSVSDAYKLFWDFSAFLFVICVHRKGMTDYDNLLELARQPLGLLENSDAQKKLSRVLKLKIDPILRQLKLL